MIMQAEYDQFIGLYPKVVSAEKCNQLIRYFEEMVEIQAHYNRQNSEGAPTTLKKDDAISVGQPSTVSYNDRMILTNSDPTLPIIGEELQACLTHYLTQYDQVMPVASFYHKIQKTLPSGGYHVWHSEQGSGTQMRRVLVYTMYLNDVEEGGETEFLYQQKRYPARKGDVCIFPAHFTHPHRGNPPLSGEKYIMTGWFEAIDIPDNFQLVPKN